VLIGIDDVPKVNAATQFRVYADQEDCCNNQQLNFGANSSHVFKSVLCKLNCLYSLLWANKHPATAVIHSMSYEDVSSMLN